MKVRLLTYLLCLTLTQSAVSAEPAVQQYLSSGQLSRGELALSVELETQPQNDQLRFGLGFLQVVRAFERVGQSLHEYGAKSSRQLIFDVPIKPNPNPTTINFVRFRRIWEDFYERLSVAESTLAMIQDDSVKSPLKLTEVNFDLDFDGQSTDRFHEILLRGFNERQFLFLKDNPDFLVTFDRGDVCWMRAYCHLIMGIIDIALSIADETSFDLWSDEIFAKPQNPFRGSEDERWKRSNELTEKTTVYEPQRLHRFRMHLLQVIQLNQQAWKWIRLETDDDHEWLPNPQQQSVIGLPVRDEMIDTWLNMLAELKLLFEGERLFPEIFSERKNNKHLNIKRLLDDPPHQFNLLGSPPEKYYEEGALIDISVFWLALRMFSEPGMHGYPAWFN